MPRAERKKQHRLWLSCTECRARKVKCDRAKPCCHCTKAGVPDQCHYDLNTESTRQAAPGQLVFAVAEPSERRDHVQLTTKHNTQLNPPSIATNRQASPSANQPTRTSSKSPCLAAAANPTDKVLVTPLQLLWHGSRSLDTYTEPLHERTIGTSKEVIFGEDDATVYWGRSHETNFVPRITDAAKLLLRLDKEDDVSTLYQIERSTRPRDTVSFRAHDAELRSLLPCREETDKLVDIYIRRFECYYRIIHIPTFLNDYARLWDPDPAVSGYGPPNFLAQLLAICAIGSAFDDLTKADTTVPHADVTERWIEVIRIWLFKQDPRAQMTLGHLQAHLLMLVAGDVHWIKIDRSWISVGMLIRNAISAGLHREPSDFTRVSPFFAELRRRLWYAILEFDLQASFAKGRAPSLRDEDYDCRQPSNIVDDRMLTEDMTDIQVKAAGLTQTSYPPLYARLAESISLRMKVCRLVNGINLTASYEQVLKLDAELKEFLDQMTAILQSEMDAGKRALLTITVRRAIIALHAPFVTRTLYDPRHLYSRQVCVEMAMTVLTTALSILEHSSDFAAINNICRCEISNSTFLVCHELLTQAAERQCRPRALQQFDGRQLILIDLIERIAQAVTVICKSDIVSQRTCAWMQLSVELSRAAVGDDAMTIISMKESIRRSIQAYKANIQHSKPSKALESGTVVEDPAPWSSEFANMFDEDYFNLFLDLHNVESSSPWERL